MRTIVKIVVPTDFSECSLEAVDEGAHLARLFGAKLYLLHVVGELTGRALSTEVGMAREAMRQTLYNEAHANFAALEPRLREVDHETAIRSGHASTAIIGYCREIDADMIVIATHGRSGLARLFIGSTTEEVVRAAECPVLTVRPCFKAGAQAAVHVHDESCACRRQQVSYRDLLAEHGRIRVRDAMRRDVVKVGPEARVRHIIDLMIHHDISGVPVVDESDILLGYVPESHLLLRSLDHLPHPHVRDDYKNVDELLEQQRQLHGKTASEVMVPAEKVVTVAESESLREAIELMLSRHVSRLPVLRDRRVVGYLTRADILRVVRSLERQPDSDLCDADIARLVRQALDRSLDVAVTDMQVSCDHGTVELHGSVSTAAEVEQATAIAMRVPGVKSVLNSVLVESLLK
jgi:nucleotide-binding universal stress UspA family protein/CBS domain-containing protein